MTATPRPKRRKDTIERTLAIAALAILALAWLLGGLRASASVSPYLPQALPGAQRFEALAGGIYAGYAADSASTGPVGYVGVGAASGYGGPMKVAVGVDPQGQILGVAIVEQTESPAWISLITNRQFIKTLLGRSFGDQLTIGSDVDAVSGATYTSRAIVDATRAATRRVAAQTLGLAVPPETARSITIGVPEIALVLLYAAAFIGHRRTFRFKKQIRWATLLTGLLVLGFLYNNPLTLSNVNALLLGYWPDWRTHLYWYLLLGGIIFVFTVDNKNPYCDWFCPFGAAQECLGALGGAEHLGRNRYRDLLVWLQRGLALAAIALALLFRNPGLTSYEIFGTLFRLTGSPLQFGLLFIILFMSLVFKRPWCTYLCPLHPVTDFIRLVRNWIRELWQNIRQKATN